MPDQLRLGTTPSDEPTAADAPTPAILFLTDDQIIRELDQINIRLINLAHAVNATRDQVADLRAQLAPRG